MADWEYKEGYWHGSDNYTPVNKKDKQAHWEGRIQRKMLPEWLEYYSEGGWELFKIWRDGGCYCLFRRKK